MTVASLQFVLQSSVIILHLFLITTTATSNTMRRLLNSRPLQLRPCANMTFGMHWNEVLHDCKFGGMTVADGQVFNARGAVAVRYPRLDRGGSTPPIRSFKTDRHFVVKMGGVVNLVNLNLTNAWVGYQYSEKYYCYTFCTSYDYGGAMRIESGAIALLVDIVFSNNVAYGGGQATSDSKGAEDLYVDVNGTATIMHMPAGSFSPLLHAEDLPGIAPVVISKCGTHGNKMCQDLGVNLNSSFVCSPEPTVRCICDKGTYSTERGTSLIPTLSCINCLEGHYQTEAGKNSCNDSCAAGQYSREIGASSVSTCINCLKGKYSSEDGSSMCVDCLEGHYQTEAGKDNCDDSCAAGQYSREIGASSVSTCIECVKGKYNSAAGGAAAACKKCIAGTWQNQSGAINCTACAMNTYSREIGASNSSTCTHCPFNAISSPGSIKCESMQATIVWAWAIVAVLGVLSIASVGYSIILKRQINHHTTDDGLSEHLVSESKNSQTFEDAKNKTLLTAEEAKKKKELCEFLEQHHLISYLDKFILDGVECKEDLLLFQSEDLVSYGLNKVQARKAILVFTRIE